MATIVDRIQALMAQKGLSQRELAKRAGYKTQSQVGNVLRRLAKNPESAELKTVAKIAKGLDVSVDWLMTGQGSPAGEHDISLQIDAGQVDYLGPRFKDLPNWSELLEGAMAAAHYPPRVWRKLANVRVVVEGPINVAAVVDMAEYVLKHGRGADEERESQTLVASKRQV